MVAEILIGPSGAVQTVSSKRAVGPYFWYFSFLVVAVVLVVVTTIAKMAKGGVVGFYFFAWAWTWSSQYSYLYILIDNQLVIGPSEVRATAEQT